MAERQCPSCGQGMAAGRLGPVGLDICRFCSGVWMEAGGLQQTLQAGPPILRRLAEAITNPGGGGPSEPSGKCPSCQVPLSVVESPSLPGARLGFCQFCRGNWLLRPVLDRVLAVLEAPAPPPEPVPARSSQPAGGSFFGPPPDAPAPPWKPAPTAAPVPDVYADQRELFEKMQKPIEPQPPPAEKPGSATRSTVPRSTSAGDPCPDCGEPNAPGAPVCWACGKMLRGKVEGTCPRCLGNMVGMNSAGVKLQCCEGCGGAWVEDGRLSALLVQPWDVQDQLLRDMGRIRTGRVKQYQQQLMCPQDGLILFPTPFGMMSPRPIDTCPQCRASFLDYGTLEQILKAQRR
jgi:Zn-finger nucleic acid-binding protein